MAGMTGVKQDNIVFGLDIGTRSIVGTVGYMDAGGKFHVVAQCIREHDTRAMLDGQIHDIVKVGATIKEVRSHLEKMLDRELNDVCIAAAGRVLRTITTSVDFTFEVDKEIDEEDVYALAMTGVEKAYTEFQKDNDTDMKFYCVGYTPIRFYMNGYQIGNLVGHKAKKIAMEIIATFLPDDVVDGLYKAVERAGLHVANLTLEPIAAIQVAIPEKFRMLNMALVDVGAGTTDISITKEGTITAYGMIPMAGDSLTEIILQHCLVDFDTAEQIKRKSCEQDVIEYFDIMGLPQTITAEEVHGLMEDTIKKLSAQAADCIKELNGDKPVSAVFVVGGGGIVSGYTSKLAEELGIVKERVAIRGQEVMHDIVFETDDAQKDSMMVTPIGICLSFYEQNNNFIFLEFNGVRTKLYDNGKLTVADVAVQAQFPNESLFPRRGEALTFLVNERNRIVGGNRGEAAVIRVNDGEADLHTSVHNGDIVTIVPSTIGEKASMELGKLPELSQALNVYVRGIKMTMPKVATVNGKRENEFYQISENDDIRIHNYYTVAEIAEFLDIPLGSNIMVNDTPAKRDTRVYENFTVSWELDAVSVDEDMQVTDEPADFNENISDEIQELDLESESSNRAGVLKHTGEVMQPESAAEAAGTEENEKVPAAGKTGEIKASTESVVNNETIVNAENTDEETTDALGENSIVVIVNSQTYLLSGKSSYVFVDVFNVIDFDLKASGGRGIITTLNGRPAEFMEPLHEGDVIEIYWKER